MSLLQKMPATEMVNLYFCLVAKNSKVIQQEDDSYGKLTWEEREKSEEDYYFFSNNKMKEE